MHPEGKCAADHDDVETVEYTHAFPCARVVRACTARLVRTSYGEAEVAVSIRRGCG